MFQAVTVALSRPLPCSLILVPLRVWYSDTERVRRPLGRDVPGTSAWRREWRISAAWRDPVSAPLGVGLGVDCGCARRNGGFPPLSRWAWQMLPLPCLDRPARAGSRGRRGRRDLATSIGRVGSEKGSAPRPARIFFLGTL